jgi:hypothetical protein
MLGSSFSLDSTFRAKISVMFKGRLLHRRYTATITLPTVTTALFNVAANTVVNKVTYSVNLSLTKVTYVNFLR